MSIACVYESIIIKPVVVYKKYMLRKRKEIGGWIRVKDTITPTDRNPTRSPSYTTIIHTHTQDLTQTHTISMTLSSFLSL